MIHLFQICNFMLIIYFKCFYHEWGWQGSNLLIIRYMCSYWVKLVFHVLHVTTNMAETCDKESWHLWSCFLGRLGNSKCVISSPLVLEITIEQPKAKNRTFILNRNTNVAINCLNHSKWSESWSSKLPRILRCSSGTLWLSRKRANLTWFSREHTLSAYPNYKPERGFRS